MEGLKDQIDEIEEQLREAEDTKRRKDIMELEEVKRKVEGEAELTPQDGRSAWYLREGHGDPQEDQVKQKELAERV